MKPTIEELEKRIKKLESENVSLKEKLEFQELFNEYSNSWETFRNKDGKLIYMSDAFTFITGFDPKNYVEGKILFLDFVHPDDLEKAKHFFQQQIDGQEFSNLVCRIIDKNSAIKYISVSSRKVFNKKKEYVGFRTSCIDITEKIKVENELRQSEEKFRHLIELAVDGILVGTHEGIIIDANSFFCSMISMKHDEIIGKHISMLPFKKESMDKTPFRFDLLQKGEIVISEREIERPDGTTIFIEMRTRMMPDKTYQSIYRDVTERKKAELALTESETRYRTFIETSPMGIIIYKETGQCIYVNPSASAITGGTIEQMMCLDFRQIKSWQNTGYLEAAEECLAKNKITRCEVHTISTFGAEMWNEAVYFPAFFENEKHLFMMISDIKERKKVEQSLKESEGKYRLLFENSQDAIMISNMEGDIIDCNPAALKIFEVETKEIFKSRKAMEYHSDIEVRKKAINRLKQNGYFNNMEVEYKTFKNNSFHALASVILTKLNGEEELIYSWLRDITERKKIEQALQESEEKYRTMVQYASEPIFGFNPDETYRFVNENYAKTVGKKTTDIIGKTPYEIYSFDEAEHRMKIVRQVFKTGERNEIEVKVNAANGETVYFLTIVDPIKDEQGNILWVSCISKNITERKSAEIKIQQQNKELRELNLSKDRFISILAHDLINPFGSLLGFSDLLIKSMRDMEIGTIEDHVKIINNSATRIYTLLEDLLTWTRAQSGNFPFDPQDIDFTTVCNEVIEGIKPQADAKKITINHFIASNIEICADVNMFKTVLRNLISNAIKFTKNGGHISIFAINNSDGTTITIKDNGIGIPPNEINKLFDIAQIHSTKGTANEKGTGLGLLLCKEFVEKHEGKIWVESIEGKGSEFKFTIPVG